MNDALITVLLWLTQYCLRDPCECQTCEFSAAHLCFSYTFSRACSKYPWICLCFPWTLFPVWSLIRKLKISWYRIPSYQALYLRLLPQLLSYGCWTLGNLIRYLLLRSRCVPELRLLTSSDRFLSLKCYATSDPIAFGRTSISTPRRPQVSASPAAHRIIWGSGKTSTFHLLRMHRSQFAWTSWMCLFQFYSLKISREPHTQEWWLQCHWQVWRSIRSWTG